MPWGLITAVMLLTTYGLACVISACFDPGSWMGLGKESRMQLWWWGLSLVACIAVSQIPLSTWRRFAMPLYIASLLVVLFMMAAAGTALVPSIKGQSNWIKIGRISIQPVEFIKLGTLLACARLMSGSGYDAKKLSHAALALLTAGVPSALVARGDLGSALTFLPMIGGLLYAAGMRLRWLALGAALLIGIVVAGTMALPKDGYQYKRVQAWLHPDEYALTEAYQTQRSMTAIGSGQWLGKGYAAGDQNRLGWVPENHTDLILSVAGEELGFVGTSFLLLLFVAFAWAGIAAASQARDPCGRLFLCGYVCMITGQASINIAVATGLMPVTGVTLPFFSYGGSSLLGSYIGLGIAIASTRAPRRAGTTSRSGSYRA
ncbi:MAG: rod shape-determining protein RodA, partial [Planctomycetes bacterium]|nr:rod shape-determining protein RodA [Planctomycetota bacterium]